MMTIASTLEEYLGVNDLANRMDTENGLQQLVALGKWINKYTVHLTLASACKWVLLILVEILIS